MSVKPAKLSFQKGHSKRVALTLVGLFLLGGIVAAVISVNQVANAGSSATIAHGFQDELRVEINGQGFNPSAIQHSAGTFDITVENSAVTGEYTLRLKAEDGTVVKEVSVQKGSAAWTVTLPAGLYTLTEASNPQWQCQITLQ